MQSLKLENKLYDTVKEKMRELQQNKMSWIEVQFLMKSVDVLSECRRTLMYTYAFSFYLKKNNQTSIFEVGDQILRDGLKKNTSYLVTLSLKVGGGQDEITLLGAAKIVTRW